MRRILGLILVVLAVVSVVSPHVTQLTGSPRRSEAPPQEPVGSVLQVFAAGIVEGAQRDVSLQFELAGRIAEIPVLEGQAVPQGAVCAKLDDAVWRNQLAEAEAALDVARAEYERLVNGASAETRGVVRAEERLQAVEVEKAKVHRDRAARLSAQQAIAAQDYDHYRFEWSVAVARHEQAVARVTEIEAAARPDELRIAAAKTELAATAVQQALTRLSQTELRAPIDGVILRVDMEPGELIAPESRQPVITMTSLNEVRVRAYVEELDALSVRPDAPAYVTVDGRPDVRYSGRVTWIAPVMGPKTHRHQQPGEKHDVEVREVLLVLEQADELVVGLPVDVYITAPAPGTDGSNSTSVSGHHELSAR